MLPTKAYTVYITRQQNWFDKKNYDAISLNELTSNVKSDFQIRLTNGYDIVMRGEVFSYRSEGLGLWKIHSHKGEMILDVFFVHTNGNIEVKYPDQETIKKMIVIASRLKAKVQW